MSRFFGGLVPIKARDIPVQTEYTRNLLPLLNRYGNDMRLGIILFTLDETTYTRELAPLAGHYPALKLGPPWWFFDSLNGMKRYFDQVMETAGLYNTSGFNDDTRAFCSIPARHDVWRRAAADWVAGLVVRHIVDMPDASDMMAALAVTSPNELIVLTKLPLSIPRSISEDRISVCYLLFFTLSFFRPGRPAGAGHAGTCSRCARQRYCTDFRSAIGARERPHRAQPTAGD